MPPAKSPDDEHVDVEHDGDRGMTAASETPSTDASAPLTRNSPGRFEDEIDREMIAALERGAAEAARAPNEPATAGSWTPEESAEPDRETIDAFHQNVATRFSERHAVSAESCEHCGGRFEVHFVAAPSFGVRGPQAVRCPHCQVMNDLDLLPGRFVAVHPLD